jgi:hypothetical protein
MSASTFRELLGQTTESAERPRPIADGHYLGSVASHEFGLSRQKQTPYVRFIINLEEETADVPAGANDGIDISRREIRKDYFITPTALYRLSDMLNAVLGKETGRTFDERIPETRGVRVMVAVGHRDNEDGTETYNEVGTIVRA